MKTLPMWGYEVDKGDYLVVDDEVVGKVENWTDEGEQILFDVRTDDGDLTQIPFGPFDTVVTVASFIDDE